VRRPTLDDVFLTLTGHAAEADGDSRDKVDGRRRRSKSDPREADSGAADSQQSDSRPADSNGDREESQP
jgi:hypothetical protein